MTGWKPTDITGNERLNAMLGSVAETAAFDDTTIRWTALRLWIGWMARMSSDVDSSFTPKVLIADDNPQILELLEAYLDPLGLQVSLAVDGQATLDAVESDPPDLILLDVMMPKRSGFEVCRILKDDPRYRDIPIIMVTALNEEADVERARECGADDFLSKPVNRRQLHSCVSRLLQVRRLSKSLKPLAGEGDA
jgi:two-component system cell cycle response regulator